MKSSINLGFLLIIIPELVNRILCNPEKYYTTSITQLNELMTKENVLIKSMENYANELELKLETIKEALAEFKNHHSKSDNNEEEYLGNPLNSFSLVRRMHEDWRLWISYVDKVDGKAEIDTLEVLTRGLPNLNDLNDTVDSVDRIQRTYDLKPDDMASGLLYGKQYDAKFNSLDTFTIGQNLLQRNRSYDAAFWLYNSQQNYQESLVFDALEFNSTSINQVYAEALVKEHRYADAVVVLKIALKSSPGNHVIEKRLIEAVMLGETNKHMIYEIPQREPTLYEKGCRGDHIKSDNLYCLYNHTSSPFAIIAPFKMEILNIDPYLVQFHDIINDNEIQLIKKLSKPKLNRALVGVDRIVDPVRISQTVWITDGDSKVATVLSRRFADMSNLDMSSSKWFQITDYISGGQYQLHCDILFNDFNATPAQRRDLDRVATILVYMNNVEQGGATIFPAMNLMVPPKKGSAVLWYNMDNRGDCEDRTLHASCPVIVGNKWVINKWVEQKDQLFRKPCYI